jgi:hypothetical protein
MMPSGQPHGLVARLHNANDHPWLRPRPCGNQPFVPMYQCDGCGWTTTGFRLDAVRNHEGDCPGCNGTIRLVFHVGVAPDLDPSQPGIRLVPGAVAATKPVVPEQGGTRTAPRQR